MIQPTQPLNARLATREDPSLSPARILVVDDSPFVRELIGSVLCKGHYRFATAENGADALQRLAQERFDLLITDWRMPVIDGGTLVLELRAAGFTLPVVMLSGDFAANPLPRVISREVYATLEKPVCIFTLLARVAGALDATTSAALRAA